MRTIPTSYVRNAYDTHHNGRFLFLFLPTLRHARFRYERFSSVPLRNLRDNNP